MRRRTAARNSTRTLRRTRTRSNSQAGTLESEKRAFGIQWGRGSHRASLLGHLPPGRRDPGGPSQREPARRAASPTRSQTAGLSGPRAALVRPRVGAAPVDQVSHPRPSSAVEGPDWEAVIAVSALRAAERLPAGVAFAVRTGWA
jgi:hypothetical protein